jgi:hypothetical protein
MRIDEILDDTKEKFFNYLLDIARNGGYYDPKDQEYVDSKVRGDAYEYHQMDNHKIITWTFHLDENGIREITKANGKNNIVMFRRKGIAPNN